GSEPYPRPPGSLFRTVYRRLERFPRAAVDLRIDGREDLDGGLVVIPSPGHTAGHLAVLVPDLGALLVGDAVWHLGPLRPSWRQVTADRPLNEASIRQLGSLPGVDRVYMGHGAPISGDRFRAFARDL
ncbi:MAG TPA: MBL fold metallo-hydrolase, partial [Actinomycetota bacterium]|nr:MBL fold metallo-hydrolase [Actinomycetota bacterium]